MWATPKQRAASIVSVPAPTMGINDFDNLANMDPIYALDMVNWFPSNRSLRVRNGYREWTTGLPSDGKTLLTYNRFNGSGALFAATDNGIFEVTSQGPAGVAQTAYTNGYCSYTNFANTAGQYMVVVNGTDPGKLYNGAWLNYVTVGGPAAPNEVSGANMANMNYVHSHKRRLWFAQKDSMTVWYLPTDSTGGAMTAFQLGGIFKLGGFIQSIFTWTMDAGDGLDDILIFQTNKGEIAGYIGNDPSSASDWRLAAVYFAGEPLSQRTNADFGGDVAMLTVNGITPISKIVGGAQAIPNSEDSLSKRISKTFNQIVRQYGYSPNWEIMNIPELTALFVTFPSNDETGSKQFVMNSITGAWTTYDLPLLSMGVNDSALYFSDTDGRILLFDETLSLDNVDLLGVSGNNIESTVVCSHNYFQMMGVSKVFSMIRPLFLSTYYPSMTLAIGTDFRPSESVALVGPTGGPNPTEMWDAGLWDFTPWYLPNVPNASDVWDVGIWDTTIWSPQKDTQYEWVGITGMGYTASLTMKLSTNTDTEFVTSDWVITPSTSL